VHFYALCWNDLSILPYFFRHYDSVVDHFFIYDNGSTDGSLAYLAAHPRTTVRHFDTQAESFGITEIRLSNQIWQQSIGKADWVVIADIDEHLSHRDLRGYFAQCRAAGVTALRSVGYDMVAPAFPPADVTLVDAIRCGARSLGYDKLCAFNPSAVTATHFGPGRHTAQPVGRVVWPSTDSVRMLHYKKLGAEYFVNRNQELRLGLGRHDILAGYGQHYLWPPARMLEEFNDLLKHARLLPGLGDNEWDAMSEADIERLIAETGLVDRPFYLTRYTDVARASIDPVRHYCAHGWREGRHPNRYFDTAWYIARQRCAGNPLLHYIREGEAADLPPSLEFDPARYRQMHGLPAGQSALRHCLTARA
jgi:hypothetical protein